MAFLALRHPDRHDFAMHHPACQENPERLGHSCSAAPVNAETPYNPPMYIIAIGWIFVTGLMALTETSIFSGLVTFVFVGLGPLALILWLLGTPERRRRQARQAKLDETEDPSAPSRAP